MSKFIKTTTYEGEVVWLNSANIVAITESPDPNYMVVRTNAAKHDGENPCYLVPGSPEVLLESLGEEVVLF